MSTTEVGGRRFRKALESRYNVVILVEEDVVPWLVRHAGFSHNRFQAGHDGKTPHARVRERTSIKQSVSSEKMCFIRFQRDLLDLT